MSKYSLMARPKVIDKDEILRVARELFLEKGPAATTAEIARALGISEGSIFKRFPTKHELFLASMKVDTPHPWAQDLEQLVGQGELKENLIKVSTGIMAFLRELLPRVMLAWSFKEAMSEHIKTMHGPQSPPRMALNALSRYLSAEMALGRLRQTDPEVAARIFLGAIWNHVFLETIEAQGEQGRALVDPELFARTLVDAVWLGLAPTAADKGDQG
jgi:AcrR family transcriptional regulator